MNESHTYTTRANRIFVVGFAQERFTAAQDVDETLDWVMDWSRIVRTDPITASEWVFEGAAATQPYPAEISTNLRKTIVWIKPGSGTSRQTLTVTNTITTAGNRVYQQEFRLRFRD